MLPLRLEAALVVMEDAEEVDHLAAFAVAEVDEDQAAEADLEVGAEGAVATLTVLSTLGTLEDTTATRSLPHSPKLIGKRCIVQETKVVTQEVAVDVAAATVEELLPEQGGNKMRHKRMTGNQALEGASSVRREVLAKTDQASGPRQCRKVICLAGS